MAVNQDSNLVIYFEGAVARHTSVVRSYHKSSRACFMFLGRQDIVNNSHFSS